MTNDTVSNNCVALVCLCLFWGQKPQVQMLLIPEQIKWGNESVFNEEHNAGLFSGTWQDKLYWQAAFPTISRWEENAVCLSENAGLTLT